MSPVGLGALALKRGDYQEAINIFKRTLDTRKDADAFCGIGIASYRLGDMPTARWALYKALELKADHREARDYVKRLEQERSVKPAPARQSRFRTNKGRFEINDGSWKTFFVKGINLGLGIPGYFPGEFSIKRGTYLKWFEQIADLGVNAVRVYTLQPPGFYEALILFNRSGRQLNLLQGIWMELPDKNDFRDSRYLSGIEADVRNAVDALFGNIVLPERQGYASGSYAYDVSPFLLGIIMGREWESCAVRGFNELQQRRKSSYHGPCLSIAEGTPFEVWITERCDGLQSYEQERYGVSHPVSVINWPTLDPLTHPSESPVEREYERQGIRRLRQGDCIEFDDGESLDVSQIAVISGNGFFASYHVYPYYPDFMINEYPGEEGYGAYLAAVKRLHKKQPVLIAEFGIPSSRDTAHWHSAGWSHGGHTEREQGAINGRLMKAIHGAGMAGGVLFSWFDEWCKKTWLFGAYSIPQERKPFWFNIQDPEQNYGLLACYPGYPGKKVTLTCRADEWKNATVLYEKRNPAAVFRFNDGHDDARRLTRMAVQHDEGFLYIRLETAAAVDFSKGHYLIGLDTCSGGAGERLLPFETNLRSPAGLTFLVHLAGKKRSRILVSASYDRYLNAVLGKIVPTQSDTGAWVIMQNQTNRRRISKDGQRFFPCRVATMSRLRFGCLDRVKTAYDSLADFYYEGNAVELRIPWSLINFTDPSSKQVLWKDKDGMTRKTEGIGLLAVSYKPAGVGLTAAATGRRANHTDCFPAVFQDNRIRTYTWHGWNTPVYHTFLKESYYHYGRVLAELGDTP